MATRADKSTLSSTRARLSLFHGTPVNAETACSMDDSEITHDLLKRSGVKALNLLAAGVGPTELHRRGVQTAHQLRGLGFDALHLCSAEFANEASMAYGAGAVVDAFLQSAQDAVALSGSEAMHILNVKLPQLLEQCAGFPGEAAAVLEQLPKGAALHGVSAVQLLDAGLRAESLKACGYGLASVINQVSPSGLELAKFGYTF